MSSDPQVITAMRRPALRQYDRAPPVKRYILKRPRARFTIQMELHPTVAHTMPLAAPAQASRAIQTLATWSMPNWFDAAKVQCDFELGWTGMQRSI